MKKSFTISVILGAILSFVLGVVIAYGLIDSSSHRHLHRLLVNTMEDVQDDVASSVDSMLFYVGYAITRHYGSPENLSQEEVRSIMRQYNIDELNVVDKNGIVLKGDLANVGFDFKSTPTTRPFMRLLDPKDGKPLAQPFRAAIEDPNIVRKYAGVPFPNLTGFVQIGFEQKRMERDVDYRIETLADGWTIGEGGYIILARRATGEILSCGLPDWREQLGSENRATLSSIGFEVLDIPDEEGVMFEQTVFGERVFCTAANVGKYHRAVVIIPASELEDSRDFSVLIVAAILFVVLFIGSVIALHLGSLNERLKAEKIASAAAQQRELAAARTIQLAALPLVTNDSAAYTLYAEMHTAREVGGDFYDFYKLPSGRLLLLIADVSGKGISAAMFMMQAKAVIKACAMSYPTLTEAVAEANRRLAEKNEADMFVTAWIAAVDTQSGEVEFVNCGHNPPLLKRADGRVEWLRTRPSLALAAMSGAKYRVEKFKLEKGDSLFLYTDGLTEAMNLSGELYGEARLEAAFKSASPLWVKDVVNSICTFVNGAEQSDDMTLLALDFGFNPKITTTT